jgi:glycosyltransferase involved in cell wall biosynthesis
VAGHPVIKVSALTAYPVSVASARVRIAAFSPFLAEQGIALSHRPSLSESDYRLLASSTTPPVKAAAVLRASGRAARDVRTAHKARTPQTRALLLVHRLLAPLPLPGFEPPRGLDVYDFDDALFLGSVAAVNRRFAWVKQEARRACSYMRSARLVIAANRYLAQPAAQLARRVEVIPSCVDPTIQPLRQHGEHETVTIGWIGSSSTVAYLQPLLETIAALHARDPHVRLVVIGADSGMRAGWLEHRPWSLERQPADLAGLDVGVMPLPDDPWTRGKSGYKLLQYFAAGVPAVASPVGVNAELLAQGRGLAATTPAAWQVALTELIEDADGRRQRGALARAFVEQRYSYQRWAPELAALLQSLA